MLDEEEEEACEKVGKRLKDLEAEEWSKVTESFLQYLNKRRKEQAEKEEEGTGWITDEESTMVDSRVKITLKDTVSETHK